MMAKSPAQPLIFAIRIQSGLAINHPKTLKAACIRMDGSKLPDACRTFAYTNPLRNAAATVTTILTGEVLTKRCIHAKNAALATIPEIAFPSAGALIYAV
jgi:hypothetical protein